MFGWKTGAALAAGNTVVCKLSEEVPLITRAVQLSEAILPDGVLNIVNRYGNEAGDADRIATLIEHFEAYPDYLVVALLPEDAAALDEDYQSVSEI